MLSIIRSPVEEGEYQGPICMMHGGREDDPIYPLFRTPSSTPVALFPTSLFPLTPFRLTGSP